ncbi:MAG: glycine cleavage system aminomethyltransferase GcvT [Acidimicrobiia bacterium]
MPQSPLHPLHEKLEARFTTFGGWEMPLRYEGVIAEHQAVRESAGVFDVSHLGRFEVTGPAATDALRSLLCNDIDKAQPGRAQYTMALNDAGGVEDDIIVWRLDQDRYWVTPNGTNFDEILGRFVEFGCETDPVRNGTVLLAVQGPGAPDLVYGVLGSVPGRFRVLEAEFEGAPVIAAGTGYTGERGAEIAVPVDSGNDLLGALIDAGAVPCGLGARDTLRLEMGYPLWGQDLDPTTTPLEAGLGWVIAWDHEFVGRGALERQAADGVERALIAFRMEGRRVPRTGYRIRSADGSGIVTSGNFSPTLSCGIGMAYVAPPPADEVHLEVEIRDDWHSGLRVDPPFIES